MSIIKVTKDDLENHTIVTTPSRKYISGSSGITGSVKVFPRVSSVEKTVNGDVPQLNEDDFKFVGGTFKEAFEVLNNEAKSKRYQKSPVTSLCDQYFDLILKSSQKSQYALDIDRIVPTPTFTSSTLAKNTVKDVLMKFYRPSTPHAHWAYTNYHALNFFTVSSSSQLVPTSSVLLFPNCHPEQLGLKYKDYNFKTNKYDIAPDDNKSIAWKGATYVTGVYSLEGPFTFNFYINPRYQVDGIDAGHLKAGTIFHLSSSYALSLVTGSSKDGKGLPDGYRLLLQLSQSAEIPPSLASQGAKPSDLVFLSDDNSLSHNKWHHVIVRWGTNTVDNGTGSFVVDGVNRGSFVVPSGTITPKRTPGVFDPAILCIGNFYEGPNRAGSSAQDQFFNFKVARKYGLNI